MKPLIIAGCLVSLCATPDNIKPPMRNPAEASARCYQWLTDFANWRAFEVDYQGRWREIGAGTGTIPPSSPNYNWRDYQGEDLGWCTPKQPELVG